MRRDLHVHFIVFGQLSRPPCRFLAVLRRLFGTPSSGVLLRRICLDQTGGDSFYMYVYAGSSLSVNTPHPTEADVSSIGSFHVADSLVSTTFRASADSTQS